MSPLHTSHPPLHHAFNNRRVSSSTKDGWTKNQMGILNRNDVTPFGEQKESSDLMWRIDPPKTEKYAQAAETQMDDLDKLIPEHFNDDRTAHIEVQRGMGIVNDACSNDMLFANENRIKDLENAAKTTEQKIREAKAEIKEKNIKWGLIKKKRGIQINTAEFLFHKEPKAKQEKDQPTGSICDGVNQVRSSYYIFYML